MRIYTTRETAKILNIRQATVRQYIHKGYIKAKKFGRDWHITEKEIEKRLAKTHDK